MEGQGQAPSQNPVQQVAEGTGDLTGGVIHAVGGGVNLMGNAVKGVGSGVNAVGTGATNLGNIAGGQAWQNFVFDVK